MRQALVGRGDGEGGVLPEDASSCLVTDGEGKERHAADTRR